MGDFFTSVQVQAGDANTAAVHGAIVLAVRSWMRSRSLTEVAPDESCDRAVVLGRAVEGRWTAVYDQSTEGQDPARLETLASMLSTSVAGPVVSILVHDSDLLQLGLFLQGEEINSFVNWPGYFAGAGKPSIPRSDEEGGRPERWRDLLVPGAEPGDLRAAWDAAGVGEDAIGILRRMVPLLGWDPESVLVGFNSLPQNISARSTRLCFRAPPAAARRELSGELPKLEHTGGIGPEVAASVGDTIQLSAIAHNTGPSSRGLTVVVWGPALDEGLVDPTQVRVAAGAPRSAEAVEAGLEAGRSEAGPLKTVTLPEFPVPMGTADQAAAFRAASGDVKRGMEIWLGARIEASLHTTALRTGAADLHIGLVPAANPDGGQTAWTVRLSIGRPA